MNDGISKIQKPEKQLHFKMKLETQTVKEIQLTTEVIKERCAVYYKQQLINALDDLHYRTAKEFLDKFISVKTKEHENDIAHHVVSETENVLSKQELDFLRKNKESHVAVLNDENERIALFPHRDLSY